MGGEPSEASVLGRCRVRLAVFLIWAGVACAAAAGFLSPFWFLGFLPVSVGLIWSALNLVEVTDGDA